MARATAWTWALFPLRDLLAGASGMGDEPEHILLSVALLLWTLRDG